MAGTVEDVAAAQAGQGLRIGFELALGRRKAQHAVAAAGDELRGLADRLAAPGTAELPVAAQVAVPVEPAAETGTRELSRVVIEIGVAQPGGQFLGIDGIGQERAAGQTAEAFVLLRHLPAGRVVEFAQGATDVLLQLGLGHARLLEVLKIEIVDAELLQRRQDVDIARRRVGHAHGRDRSEEIGPPEGGMPGDGRAPVVPHDDRLRLAERLHQLGHVAHQMIERVLVDRFGRLRAAIAAHVGRDGAETGLAHRLELMAPRIPALRPAMAEQDERSAPCLGVTHVDVVGRRRLERDARHR